MNLQRTNPTLFYLQRTAFYVLVIAITLYLLFPFAWAILTAFSKGGNLFLTPGAFLIAPKTLDNFKQVFANPAFQNGLIFSLIAAVGSVAISILFGSFAAYALGRFRFVGKQAIMYII